MATILFQWFLCLVIALNFGSNDALVGSKSSKEPFFRKDYEYIPFLGAFYKVHAKARSWSEARTRCEREGAALAVPETAEEAREMQRLMDNKLTKLDAGAFIGMHDFLSEGEFITLDGVPAKDVYHSWAAGEPNNAKDGEHCVLITRSGQLNDENCNTRYSAICKKSLATLDWNEDCSTADPGYKRLKDMYTCHKFHAHPLNWTDAYATCLAEEGYLAVISTQTEKQALVDLVSSQKLDQISGNYIRGAVHLGFHNRFSGPDFMTIFGETLEQAGYSSWGGGQPDNAGGHELCGSMFHSGGLNDISCETRALFICERALEGAAFGLEARFNHD